MPLFNIILSVHSGMVRKRRLNWEERNKTTTIQRLSYYVKIPQESTNRIYECPECLLYTLVIY